MTWRCQDMWRGGGFCKCACEGGPVGGPGALLTPVLPHSLAAWQFTLPQYPKATKMVAYGEFRQGFNKDKTDTRVVAYGIRYLIEHYIAKPWTIRDVDLAEAFYATHMGPDNSKFPFPRPLFEKFVKENRGYFPVKIEALPEGTCVHTRIPMYQVRRHWDFFIAGAAEAWPGYGGQGCRAPGVDACSTLLAPESGSYAVPSSASHGPG